MNHIEIIGLGQTRCAEKWNVGLLDLAIKAAAQALAEAKDVTPCALIAANALSGALFDQRNLGTFIADRLGLHGIETHTVATDEASGGSAIRLASALIQAGRCEAVLVVGAEKTSDALPDQLEAVRATGLDALQEAEFGFSPTIAAALGMQQYLQTHGLDKGLFYHLSEIAHRNGAHNPKAIFPWVLKQEQYAKSPMAAAPLSVCDNAPSCDGGAAVLLRRSKPQSTHVRLLASAAVSGPTGIAAPITSLALPAAQASAARARDEAGLALDALSLFELHDVNAFFAALSIEAVGLAPRGEALTRAAAGHFYTDAAHPLWTMGGHKSRGIAPGAAGVYQLVEAALQLRQQAGPCQVPNAKTALVQCLGSFGALAVTHIIGV